MRRGSARTTLQRATTALVVSLITALPVAPSVLAGQAWSTSAAPTSLTQNVSTDVLVTVRNTSGNNGGGEGIGCVTILVPAAYRVDAVSIDSVDGGHSWQAAVAGSNPAVISAHGVDNGDRIVGSPDLEAVVIRVTVTGLQLGSAAWTADEYNDADCSGDFNRTQSIAMSVVTPPNSAPSATDDAASVRHDQTKTVAAPGVLGNDTDPNADPLTAAVSSGPAHGSLTLAPDGGWSYTPDAAYVGPDSFTYRASDGSLTSNIATVTISVTNAAPVGIVDSYAAIHGLPMSIGAGAGVLHNDSDGDGDPLTAAVVSGPAHGTLSAFSTDGSFTYVPDLLYLGSDSFTYEVSDGISTVGPITVTLNVFNSAPTAADDAASVVHDGLLIEPAASGILANDSDADGDALTAVLVTDATHGTLTLDPDGAFQYVPDAGYVGGDQFTYRASDGLAASSIATVSLTVSDVAPAAAPDSYSVVHDRHLSVDAGTGVLANDADADGDPVTAALVTSTAHGLLAFAADGSFDYLPDAGWTGLDTFTYRATSPTASSSVTTVSIDVTNSSPAGVPDSYAVHTGATLVVAAASGVLANDTDADGDPLSAVLQTGVVHGAVTLRADGGFTYTSDPGWVGTDTLTYLPADPIASGSPVTVTITITDAAPQAVDDSATVVHDRTLSAAASGVLANDSDSDGDAITAVLDSAAGHGLVTLNSDGSWTYAPDAGYVGQDTFTYHATDGALDSASATVVIDVTNAAPAVSDDAANGSHDRTIVVPAPGVLANDTDGDGDALSATMTTPPSHGTVTLAPNGGYTYQPDPGYVGTDAFSYSAADGPTTTPGSVTVTVTNALPSAQADSYVMVTGSTLTVAAPGLLVNDTDADHDTLTATVVSSPAHGTASIGTGGSLVYTPAAGFTGVDHLTYLASDGLGSSGVVSVAVKVVPRAPSPTPTPTPTPSPTPTPTDSPTPAPSSPGETAGPSPVATPSATPAPSAATPSGPVAEPSAPLSSPSAPGSVDRFVVVGGSSSGPTANLGESLLAASVSLALDGFDWQIPGLMLSVPGLLVVLAITLQVGGGLAWLPVIRRKLSGAGVARDRASSARVRGRPRGPAR